MQFFVRKYGIFQVFIVYRQISSKNIIKKPRQNIIDPRFFILFSHNSGRRSSITTKIIAPAAKESTHGKRGVIFMAKK